MAQYPPHTPGPIIGVTLTPAFGFLLRASSHGERPGTRTEGQCVRCGKRTWAWECCPPAPGGYGIRVSAHAREGLVLHAPDGADFALLRAAKALGLKASLPDLERFVHENTPPGLEIPVRLVDAQAELAFVLCHILMQRDIADDYFVLLSEG